MNAQTHSLLIVFSVVGILWGAYSYWSVRRYRSFVRAARIPESPAHGPWLPTAEQITSCLLHEERYFLKAFPGKKGKKGKHQVFCEERYCGRLSGAVIASRPPRPIAEAKSLKEGRDMLSLFHEVSTKGTRAA